MSGALRALAESSLAKIYSHISTSSLDTLDKTRESLHSRVTAPLHYSKLGQILIRLRTTQYSITYNSDIILISPVPRGCVFWRNQFTQRSDI